jgi:hypothetical protein
MAGEEYESPVTGLKYTVPIYEEPADAPLAFKEFADSITVGGPASRENAVLQALEGDSGLAWAEGMALQVVDAVPDDTDGEIGDVVFIPGGPGGSTPAVGGGKVLQVVRATLDSNISFQFIKISEINLATNEIAPVIQLHSSHYLLLNHVDRLRVWGYLIELVLREVHHVGDPIPPDPSVNLLNESGVGVLLRCGREPAHRVRQSHVRSRD